MVVATLKTVLVNSVLFLAKTVFNLLSGFGLYKLTDGQPRVFEQHGVRFGGAIRCPEQLQALADYDNFYPDDVLIYTFPKAGTHFAGDVVYSIFAQLGRFPKTKDDWFGLKGLEGSPPMSKDWVGHFDKLPSPRVVMTHLPWEFLPAQVKQHQIKTIHCIRNPKDLACSYYPFLKDMSMLEAKTSWDDFLDMFVTGRLIYGDYFDFMRKWYPHRNKPNMLTVYYEDMKQDLKGEVKRIVEFLDVELTDEQIDHVVKENTFENKKKQVGKVIHYRQGQSGTWKNKFTVTQSEMFDRWIEDGRKGMEDLQVKFV